MQVEAFKNQLNQTPDTQNFNPQSGFKPENKKIPPADLLTNKLAKLENDKASSSGIQAEIITDPLSFLQKNCFDLYVKVFLQLDTIAQVSQLNRENHRLALRHGHMTLRIAKLVENVLKILEKSESAVKKNENQIYAEITKVIAAYDINRAVKMAQQILNSEWKSYALCQMAELEAGKDAESALEIAQSIPDNKWKANALTAVSSHLVLQRPVLAKQVLDKVFKAAELVEDKFYQLEARTKCLDVLSKMDTAEADRYLKLLEQQTANLAENTPEDKWCKSIAYAFLAASVSPKDRDHAKRLLSKSYACINSVPQVLRKIDGLAWIYKAYQGINPKKAKKYLKAAQFLMRNTDNTGVQVLGAIYLIEKIPFRQQRTIDALLQQANRAVWLLKDDKDYAHMQTKIIKVQAQFYPTQSIKEAKLLKPSYYRALAYCYIAQSLLGYNQTT